MDRYLGYRSNSKDWYTKTLIAHGIRNARVIQADAKQLDYTQFAPVAFCFLDIDLYNPIASVLPRLHDVLAPGGMMRTRSTMAPDRSIANFARRGELHRRLCTTISASSENADRDSGAAEVPSNAWSPSLAPIQASPGR